MAKTKARRRLARAWPTAALAAPMAGASLAGASLAGASLAAAGALASLVRTRVRARQRRRVRRTMAGLVGIAAVVGMALVAMVQAGRMTIGGNARQALGDLRANSDRARARITHLAERRTRPRPVDSGALRPPAAEADTSEGAL